MIEFIPDNFKGAFKRQAGRWLAKPELTRDIFNEVLDYLGRCSIFVPSFRHRIAHRFFGSHFIDADAGPFLLLGCYPSRFMTEWLVMHEVGHVLWHFYQPCRSRAFRRLFGVPQPNDYSDIHERLSWYGPFMPCVRPPGEPSFYGAEGGGEERFCELIGRMYATGGFDNRPPKDLSAMWNACWNHGLARMTHDKIRNA
ncbi:MAG: hypothetical protein WCT04_24040 [Planctomycetota bacterium]